MKTQTAHLQILALALTGALVEVTRGESKISLVAGSDTAFHLQPGDELTIKVASDERWLERRTKADEEAKAKATQRDDVDHGKLTDLDAQARAEIDARPEAGPDLSGAAGQTLAEGLEQAEAADPADPGTAPGAVTRTTGATTRRSTRAI